MCARNFAQRREAVMADNSNNRKKTLVISVLAFLFAGGGVFLFFVIQGANDLTGAGKSGSFTYGNVAREAATSFFKFVGFDDVESITKGGYKERQVPPWLKEAEEKARKDFASSAAGAAGDAASDWGSPAPRTSGVTTVPRMASRGGSGVGGLGGGGTQSSGGVSRFGEGGGAGNTRVSAKPVSAAGGPAGKGAMRSLANARAMLGDGLRSGSAMTAKAKWDSSFGVGRSGGAGGELAYGKSGLVNLDRIKKGEVDNLKTTEKGSLKVPEVGAPERDKEGEARDPVLNKAKEAAEEAIKKNVAQAMVDAAGSGLRNSGSSGSDSGDSSRGLVTESGACDLNAGPPTQLCSTALDNKQFLDDKVAYTAVGNRPDGKIYKVTYSGSATVGSGADAGGTRTYSSTATALVKKDGTVQIISWGDTEWAPAK